MTTRLANIAVVYSFCFSQNVHIFRYSNIRHFQRAMKNTILKNILAKKW